MHVHAVNGLAGCPRASIHTHTHTPSCVPSPHHALHTAMMTMMMAAAHPLHTTTPRHATPQLQGIASRGGLTRPGLALHLALQHARTYAAACTAMARWLRRSPLALAIQAAPHTAREAGPQRGAAAAAVPAAAAAAVADACQRARQGRPHRHDVAIMQHVTFLRVHTHATACAQGMCGAQKGSSMV